MFYNWLEQDIFTTIDGKDYVFSKANNPYDLQTIIDKSWVKDAIARGYFQQVANDSSDNLLE